MEQAPAAAVAASSGDTHTSVGQPAIFKDPSALQVVFAKLSPGDLCAVVQTCRTLRQLADTQWVWKSQAERKWGALAAPHLGGYQNHKTLMLDDCRRAAVLSLPLPQDTACSYLYQQPQYFFKCKLLQLQWVRGDNSLRLSFDARGEADLRHPMTSSLAIVQLQPSRQQPQQQQQQHLNPASTSAAAAATTAAVAAAAPGGGVHALDWSRKLAVFSPDDCQLVNDTPGHFKGVLVWHSSKCSSILSLLLANQQQQQQLQQQQRQQQQQGAPPLEQHRHAQRSRRSEAWEDWADWELEQQQQQEQEAQHAAASAGSSNNSSGANIGYNSMYNNEGWLMGLLQAVVGAAASHQQHQHLQQQEQQLPAAVGASSVSGFPAGAAAAPAAEVGLVFCYANDLSRYSSSDWAGFGLKPDYRPALLVTSPGSTQAAAAAAKQQPHIGGVRVRSTASGSDRTATASSGGNQAAGGSCVHVPAMPVVDLQLPVQLHHPQEPHWASAWLQLPAACVQQRGLLEQQLQAESAADEEARWSDLPEAVKRRGAAWWK